MFDALEFQDQCIFNDEIDPISAVELYALILDGQGHLSFESDLSQVQFMAKALLIGGLKETGTQSTMDFDRRANHLLSEFFMEKSSPCLGVSVVNSVTVNHVCSTPTLNSATSGFRAAASRAWVMASRVSEGSIILSIHSRAAP